MKSVTRTLTVTGILLMALQLASSAGWAYPCHAVLNSTGPFSPTCGISAGVLGDTTEVYVFWDGNNNGPDASDRTPCAGGYICIPEESRANRYMFYLDSGGALAGALFEAYPGQSDNGLFQLYLCIYFGPSRDSCHVSPEFTLYRSNDTTQVDLPWMEWTCGPSPVLPEECMPSTFELNLDRNDPGAHSACLNTCTGGGTSVLIADIPDGSPYIPAVVTVVSGCDHTPERPAAFRFNPGVMDQMNFGVRLWWWVGILGLSRGCVTVSILDSVPVASVDTFSFVQSEELRHLRWHSRRESSVSVYTVWRLPLHFGPVDSIGSAAARGDSGWYDIMDSIRNTWGGYHSYTLVASDSSGTPYPSRFLPAVWLDRLPAAPSPFVPSPSSLSLSSQPNPFNATTEIAFELPHPMKATLTIYNLLGERVATLLDGRIESGEHRVSFDGSTLPSGIYFCRLSTEQGSALRKMVLLK